MTTVTMSTADASKYAELKPAFLLHLDADEPKPVLANKAQSEVVVFLTGGYTKTLDPSYPFDLDIDFGWDTLTTRTLTPETTSLDCHLYGKTKGGKGVHLSYTGVVVGTQAQLDVIIKKSNGHNYDESYMTMHPKAMFDDGVGEESWITKKNLLGRGRFLRDQDGKLQVEYYVYVLE